MKYRAWHIICLLLIALLAQSCVNDYDACEDDRLLTGEVWVKFMLKLDHSGNPWGRAGVWNPSSAADAGSSFDNYIDKSSLIIFVVKMNSDNSDGDLLNLEFEDVFMSDSESGGYVVSAKLDMNDKKWGYGTYRIMVIANWAKNYVDRIKACRTLSELNNIAHNKEKIDGTDYEHRMFIDWYNNDGSKNYTGYLPMWGVTTKNLFLDGMNDEDFGEIKMLRSVAKVKIELNQTLSDAGFRLVKAEASYFNKKIFVLPGNWMTAETTEDAGAYYDDAFNAYKSVYEGLTINCGDIDSEEKESGGSITFYMPEWNVKDRGQIDIVVTTRDADGNEYRFAETPMTITNDPTGSSSVASHYKNDIRNINRNHFYDFEIDAIDVELGKIQYKVNCWEYVPSSIGWNPVNFKFTASDPEAVDCAVSAPNYPKGSNEIDEGTSYADYEFTLTEPEGAVWKAFLVQPDSDGNEQYYSAEDIFTSENSLEGLVLGNTANTPTGFFFGTGNDNKNNRKAATTGIARDEAYTIKIGTRLNTVDISKETITGEDGGNTEVVKPEMLVAGTDDDGNPIYSDDVMQNNSNGLYWQNLGKVPTCYLVIRVALDGKNFSEELPINRKLTDPTLTDKERKNAEDKGYAEYQFAGSETRIEIRQMFPFLKVGSFEDLLIGVNREDKKNQYYETYTWWGYPEGHKDAQSDKVAADSN